MGQATKKTVADMDFPSYKKNLTQFSGIGDNGHLWVEGCDCVALAETFGTPLYVISENQLRYNYRRFRDAFQDRYPDVEILFANKCNNSLAIRHVMNQEGAGGDCFGVNELYLALSAGTDPRSLVLNGSNKEPEEIEMAVRNGVGINLDAMDELDIVYETAKRLGRDVDVGIRLRLLLEGLESRFGADLHGSGSLAQQSTATKWGMTLEQTVELVKRIQDGMPNLHLTEVNYHLARLSHEPEDFAEMARDMVRWSAAIRDRTGWTPPCIDLGGGWTVGRPEKTGPGGEDDETTPSFEQYAEATCKGIKDECAKQGLPLPKVKIEPGRAVAANSTLLLGRVGAVKEAPGFKKWVNVDISQSFALRSATSNWHYHILAANKAAAPLTEVVDIVGPLCSTDELGKARDFPPVVRGDLVALLDCGAYAESTVACFNAQLRPATVLVCGDIAEVTTERQQMRDLLGLYKVPPRLLWQSFGAKKA